MRLSSYIYMFVACNGLLVSSPSIAQTVSDVRTGDDSIEEITIVHPLLERGTSQSLSVLRGDELAEKLAGSLGETVAREPGVRSAGFGAAVGRPVIHGLGGARVKTTQDRIDSLDVSVTSPDHAVTVEPFIANSISILKGASTLLYGAGAIGGVVDVETGRVPLSLPDKPVSGRAEVRVADNANARTGAARLDGKFSNSIAWHVDAFTKEADDYDIPVTEGVTLGSDGSLFGSFLDSQGGAVGLSAIGESGLIGFSLSTTDAIYGLLDGEQEELPSGLGELQGGIIDLAQTRFDIDARLDQPLPGITQVSFRFGLNDYQHEEIEGSGEVGTLFENDAWEARLELQHKPIAGFAGTLGLQLGDREFSAVGEEAFISPTDTQSVALFWLAERQFSGFDLEAGVRFEEVEHLPSDNSLPELDFSTVSASFGLVVPFNDATRVSALFDYSSRAPTIEELFSNGPHLATQTFEVGDISLEEESAASVSLSISHQSKLFALSATLYHNEFNDFIYQQNIGLFEEGLPVLVYTQDDARFTGLDVELIAHVLKVNGTDLDLGFVYDRVAARLDSSAPVSNRSLPRIPSDRYGVYVNWHSEAWDIKLEYSRVDVQNQTAEFELPTAAFDEFGFRLGRHFELADNELTIYLQGRNLTDEEQRNHTSFVKDFAPAPGRRIELGVQFSF